MSLAEHWGEVVTVALLGTDRRDAPSPPDGALADLAADRPVATPSQRLLQHVAATTVAMRAGVVPAEVVPGLAPPPEDARPITSPAVTELWAAMVAAWPVLDDEFTLAVVHSGRRLAPELVPRVLARHRQDAVRHARSMVAAGPLGPWLVEQLPRLACSSRGRPNPEAPAELPVLAITPELVPLLGAPPAQVVDVVAGGFVSGGWANSHKAVLVNLVARVQPAALSPLADALARVAPSSPVIGMAYGLAELARLRHQLLTELEPA